MRFGYLPISLPPRISFRFEADAEEAKSRRGGEAGRQAALPLGLAPQAREGEEQEQEEVARHGDEISEQEGVAHGEPPQRGEGVGGGAEGEGRAAQDRGVQEAAQGGEGEGRVPRHPGAGRIQAVSIHIPSQSIRLLAS